jgi:hypothetical protein
MNELETALQNHNWSLAGYVTRPAVDQVMRVNEGAEATVLWEKYCPWSNSNGGYIAWSKK